jgi:hypothetical protein
MDRKKKNLVSHGAKYKWNIGLEYVYIVPFVLERERERERERLPSFGWLHVVLPSLVLSLFFY